MSNFHWIVTHRGDHTPVTRDSVGVTETPDEAKAYAEAAYLRFDQYGKARCSLIVSSTQIDGDEWTAEAGHGDGFSEWHYEA